MVDPAAGVRADEVERIYHRTSGLEPKYQSSSQTFGNQLKYIAGRSFSDSYTVAIEADVPRVISAATRDFEEIAFPFFERASSLEKLNVILNEQLPSTRFLVYERVLRGLIVAKLLRRSDYSEMADAYRGRLNPHHLPQFEALLADLASI